MADESKHDPVAEYVSPIEKAAIRKLDGSAGQVESNSLEYEDEFKGAYTADWKGAPGVHILQPPVMPKTLQALIHQNNTLLGCIDAMVTNVHETGTEIALAVPPKLEPGQEPVEDSRVTSVKAFFDEVWPGMSFQQLRKRTGKDKESTGNAYWEILRNLRKEMVMIRPMETKLTRMVRLSDPVDVEVSLTRGGQKVSLRVPMRYRRFVQSMGAQFIFYKEYGCPLLINKKTGELLEDTPANRQQLYRDKAMGTEVLHFVAEEDVETPYGVPKWYPQMPSVLGSRKAEEHNLDYFDSGGVPPLMIFVEGGVIGSKMKDALAEFLSSKPGAKQGAPVFEIMSTGGSLDSGGGSKATVKIERFGSERQQDSMFEAYDDKCESRVRRAWRLPPIFVGKADDYNLATAQASYAVAEAQVFKPDRDEFDEKMNSTIMRELDPTGAVVMRSRGLPVKDVNQQLTALQQAWASGGLDIDHYIEQLNEVTSLSMKVRATAKDEQTQSIKAKNDMADALVEVAKRPPPEKGGTGSQSGPSNSSPKPKTTTKKGDEVAMNLARALTGMGGVSLEDVTKDIGSLDLGQVLAFKHQLHTGEFLDILTAPPVAQAA